MVQSFREDSKTVSELPGRDGPWSPDGAEVILKLRAIVVNGDLDDYMNYYKTRYRHEIHLARYDPASIPDLGLTA